jgi:hypothetical protein
MKKAPVCRKCFVEMNRIPRGMIVMTFLFWLPFKRYCCFGCLGKRYILDFQKKKKASNFR